MRQLIIFLNKLKSSACVILFPNNFSVNVELLMHE